MEFLHGSGSSVARSIKRFDFKIFFIIPILPLFVNSSESFNFTSLEFPKQFIFGTATASYQVEGAWNISGKGESIWDRLTHTKPEAIKDLSNGDIACDNYHKYKEDIKLIKDLGFKMYRFSLSWPRLFPDGYTSNLNEEGLKFYNAVIDELLVNGIEPMVTLYHWDLPQSLEDDGGWLNANISNIFGDYARACFQHFGDRVKWWLTINEPYLIAAGYGNDSYAPMLIENHGIGEYIAGHNVLLAHAHAYRIYDKEFRPSQGGLVSLSLFGNFFLPKNESSITDIEATERINQFTIGWFAHPIYSFEGDYPQVMRDYVDRKSFEEGRSQSRLPVFSKEEIEYIKGSFDYFGLNHYSSEFAEEGVSGLNPSRERDMNVRTMGDPSYPSAIMPDFQVIPKGFRAALRWVKKQYNNPKVFITENGYCDGGELQDEQRISYISDHLKEIVGAINEDGSNILGYIVWSILDNFEWRQGYTIKFGLVHVDFNNTERTRTKKLSAQFFTELNQRHTNMSDSASTENVSYIVILLICLLPLLLEYII